MKILSIDIGNTSTHHGLVETDDWTLTQNKFKTSQLKETLPALLKETQCDGVAFCSVVPRVTQEVEILLETHTVHSFHLNHQNCPGLTINYPKPQEIGQDRLADAIAAQAFFGVPSVVIDMGTAVTFDIVTDAGYEGGIIAPGLEVMTRYLHEQTALLPELDPTDLIADGGIGKTTIDAMKLGCAVGFSGMISALLQRVFNQLKAQGIAKKPKVIGTGGSAGKLLKDAVPDIVLEPNMILLGLAEAFRRSHGENKKN